MHIGFLTPEYPHLKTGVSAGLGSSIKNLGHSLVRRGIEVSIFIYGQNKNEELDDQGLKLYLIGQRSYRFLGWYLHRKFLEKYLNKLIEENNVDLIEVPDWTGITAFMNLKCPLVLRMHGSDAYFCKLEGRKQKRKNYWFEKKALTGADHLLSVSQFTANKTREIFQLEKNIKVIPNGVDVDQFAPGISKPEDYTLLYFGSLIRKKGVIELAKIFNKVMEKQPNTFLTMVGKDVIDLKENRSTLAIIEESLSKEAKSHFKYVPEVPYKNIGKFIVSHTLIVFPSFAEAFPMTWLEAMAMGKALVTSNIGWANEIMINGKTGFMEDPRNHSAFAEKILILLEDKAGREKMENYSRQRVSTEFSSQVVALKNIEYYQSLL